MPDYRRLAAALPDPIRFSEQILHHKLTEDQKTILRAIQQHDRVLVRSGNGLGKAFLAGGNLMLWWIARYPDGVCLTIAPTLTQSKAQIWEEARKTLAQGGDDAIEFEYGEANQASIHLRAGNYASAVAQSERQEGIRLSGYHGRLLLIVDEAISVAPNIWSQIAGLQSAGNVKVLCLFNPLVSAGPVFEASKSGQWHEIVLSWFESSPNFQWRNSVKPNGFTQELLRGLPANLEESDSLFECDPQWADSVTKPYFAYQMLQEYGEDSMMYQSRVLGAWPGAGDDGLINVDWVLAANQRWREEDPDDYLDEPIVFGVDVARYGSASSVVVVRQGPRVLEIQSWRGNALTSTAGRIMQLAQKYRPVVINVDDPGVGGGVVDMLSQEGLPVRGVNTGVPAIHEPRKFINVKSEISFHAREMLRQGLISLPPDAELQTQLCGVRYEVTSHGGRLQIEDKKQSMARGLPSPDKADALFLALGLDGDNLEKLYRYAEQREGLQRPQRPARANGKARASVPSGPSADDLAKLHEWHRRAATEMPIPPLPAGWQRVPGDPTVRWVGYADAPGAPERRERSVEQVGIDANLGSIDQLGLTGSFADHFERASNDPRIGWNGAAGAPGANLIRLHLEAQQRRDMGPLGGRMPGHEGLARFNNR